MRFVANPLMRIMNYHLRKRGILTFYWVCNYDADFRKAINHGASGIMTDNPATLHNFIEANCKKPKDALP